MLGCRASSARRTLDAAKRSFSHHPQRFLSNTANIESPSPSGQPSTQTIEGTPAISSKNYFKITLLRSAISLGERKQGTLKSLGIRHRMQTVYHPHSPECAGKILAVKELVRVENVGQEEVRTQEEQRRERRASRGFKIVGGLMDRDLDRLTTWSNASR